MTKTKKYVKAVANNTTKKIILVLGTLNHEKTWKVKLEGGKIRNISQAFIFKNKLITPETNWIYLRSSCLCRRSPGKNFRFIFWNGFAEPTEEPDDGSNKWI
jgi:hypothetical protein